MRPQTAMTRRDTFRPEELALHGAALRRLARRLVRDGGEAEDLVQDAYAAALASPPRSAASLAAWLARVVRRRASDLRRGELRRARREQLAARPEQAPDAAAERLAVHDELLAAVRGLREPYRTALVLRYFEGLPPAAIARRVGAPVKTVKTRLARGLEELRARLDAGRGGERRAWALAFAPLAGPPGLAPLLLLEQGLLTMGLKIAAAAALAAALALLGIWRLGAADSRPASPATERVSEASAAAPEPLPAPPAAPGPEEQRRASPLPGPEGGAPDVLASVAVQAVYGDGSAAAGVALALRAEDDPAVDRAALQVITDADGRARADGLHAGRIALESDRGGLLRLSLAAGEQRAVRFEIPRGIDVGGVVLDGQGHPVGGAGIWLSTRHEDWLGGRVVGRADGSGRFFLRCVDPTQSLGALAAGFAPSELVDLELGDRAGAGGEVELRLLRPGAALAGRVLGEGDAPVAGALVALGRRGARSQRVDATLEESWSPLVARTGSDGAFRFEAAEPGDTLVSVRADGYTLWSAESRLAGGATVSVEARLERGARVRGRVRDGSGAPAAGILVQASRADYDRGPWGVGIASPPNPFGRAAARTDAAGAYELRCAPAGGIHLLAGDEDLEARWLAPRGWAELLIEAAPGAELAWDPVLSLGAVIRGRIAWEASGGPRLMTIVTATPEVEGARPVSTFNDEEGRFVLPHCDPAPYTLAINGTDFTLSGVWPDAGEVLLMPRLDRPAAASVRGSFADAGGRLGDGPPTLRLESAGGVLTPEATLAGEDFRFEGLPPGRYDLVAFSGDATVRPSAPFEVLPGEELDLRRVVTRPGGALSVQVETRGGAVPARPRAVLGEGLDGRVLAWDGQRFSAAGLEPGTHFLYVSEEGLHARPVALEIRAGEQAEGRVTLEPGARVRLVVAAPPDGEPWTRLAVRVRDATGALLAQHLVVRRAWIDFPLALPTDLPAGTFTLSTELDTGRTAERAFSVPNLSAPPAEVPITP